MTEVYDSRTADKFVVRFPNGMRARISEKAANNQRSTNSEIVACLTRYLNEGEEKAVHFIPQVGMLVFTRGNGIGVIEAFSMADGEMRATVCFFANGNSGHNILKSVPVADLKPYLV